MFKLNYKLIYELPNLQKMYILSQLPKSLKKITIIKNNFM